MSDNISTREEADNLAVYAFNAFEKALEQYPEDASKRNELISPHFDEFKSILDNIILKHTQQSV